MTEDLTFHERRAWDCYLDEIGGPHRKTPPTIGWHDLTEEVQDIFLVKTRLFDDGDKVNLATLIPAVRRAKAPDREIDRAVMLLAHFQERRFIGATCDCCEGGRHLDLVWVDRATDKWVSTHAFDFTTSVDAVLRQIKARLKRYHAEHGWTKPNEHGLRVYYASLSHDRKPRVTGVLYGRSEALALLQAYLTAEFLELAASLEGPR